MSFVGKARAAVASQPKLRAAAGRVVDALVSTSRTAPPGLRGAPDGVRQSDVQTVVVAILGADADVVATTIEDLKAAAREHGALRTVLAVEGQHLQVVRRAGLPVEHLISAGDWEGRAGSWSPYLRERLDTARTDYAADAVLVLGRHGSDGLAPEALAAAVRRPAAGRVTRWFRSRVAALEGALDRPSGG